MHKMGLSLVYGVFYIKSEVSWSELKTKVCMVYNTSVSRVNTM